MDSSTTEEVRRGLVEALDELDAGPLYQRPACWKCGRAALGEISTGPPEHRWHYWCRRCLIANRRG